MASRQSKSKSGFTSVFSMKDSLVVRYCLSLRICSPQLIDALMHQIASGTSEWTPTDMSCIWILHSCRPMLGAKASLLHSLQLGWRPSLLGWRPSSLMLLGWRPLLLETKTHEKDRKRKIGLISRSNTIVLVLLWCPVLAPDGADRPHEVGACFGTGHGGRPLPKPWSGPSAEAAYAWGRPRPWGLRAFWLCWCLKPAWSHEF